MEMANLEFPLTKEVFPNAQNRYFEKERIELLRPSGKTGPVILRKQYELLCIFIFSTLESNKEITLIELLEAANEKLVIELSGEFLWMILSVKNDLEARNFIKIRYVKKCVQVISLKRSQGKSIRLFLGSFDKNVDTNEAMIQQFLSSLV